MCQACWALAAAKSRREGAEEPRAVETPLGQPHRRAWAGAAAWAEDEAADAAGPISAAPAADEAGR